jgi:hypothetical protein
MRPFHFLAEAREIVEGRELAARARRAESIGYHGLVIPDHLIAQLAPIPAMATIAAGGVRRFHAPQALVQGQGIGQASMAAIPLPWSMERTPLAAVRAAHSRPGASGRESYASGTWPR